MQRFGQVIGLRPEDADEYIRLHADVWPGVLKKIEECNIRNYSILPLRRSALRLHGISRRRL